LKFFAQHYSTPHLCRMPKHTRDEGHEYVTERRSVKPTSEYHDYSSLFDYVIGAEPHNHDLPETLGGAAAQEHGTTPVGGDGDVSDTESYASTTQVDAEGDQEEIMIDEEIMEPPPAKEGRGVRRWCFTLNNYQECEVNMMKDFLTSHADYHIVHYEVGKQGTPHLQGYFRLKNTAVSSAIHKKPGFKRASLFICKGTEEQNIKYCSKGGPDSLCSTSGIPQPGQGARSDLKEAAARVRDGGHKAIKAIAQETPEVIVKYGRGFKELLEVLDVPRSLTAAPEAVWYYGESGSGKSMAAYALAAKKCEDMQAEQVELDSGLFPFCDGYRDEEVIILNDFRQKNHHGQDIPLDLLLKMVDRFPFRVNIKGSSRQIKGKVFIFTNTQHPSHFFTEGGSSEPQKQWLRRITRVVKCVKTKVNGEYVYSQIECGNGEQPETFDIANSL